MNPVLRTLRFVLRVGQTKGKKSMESERVNPVSALGKIAGKRGRQLLAPVLLTGTTNALFFNSWLEHHLIPELRPHSLLIADNAAFHSKGDIRDLVKTYGHSVLFLPPYSPDYSPIEQDFAILKKQRIYAPSGTTLDELVKLYGN